MVSLAIFPVDDKLINQVRREEDDQCEFSASILARRPLVTA